MNAAGDKTDCHAAIGKACMYLLCQLHSSRDALRCAPSEVEERVDSVALRRDVRLGDCCCRREGASVISDMSRLLLSSSWSSSAFTSCLHQTLTSARKQTECGSGGKTHEQVLQSHAHLLCVSFFVGYACITCRCSSSCAKRRVSPAASSAYASRVYWSLASEKQSTRVTPSAWVDTYTSRTSESAPPPAAFCRRKRVAAWAES